MPLTILDPNTALIVIDLQKGIVNGNFIHPIGEIVDRTRALIDVFRAKNVSFRQGCEACLCESGPTADGLSALEVIGKQGVHVIADAIAQIVADGAHTV